MSLTHIPQAPGGFPGSLPRAPPEQTPRPKQPGWGGGLSLHSRCGKGTPLESWGTAREAQIKNAGSLRGKEVYCDFRDFRNLRPWLPGMNHSCIFCKSREQGKCVHAPAPVSPSAGRIGTRGHRRQSRDVTSQSCLCPRPLHPLSPLDHCAYGAQNTSASGVRAPNPSDPQLPWPQGVWPAPLYGQLSPLPY